MILHKIFNHRSQNALEQDTFIIFVYDLVADLMKSIEQQHKFRRAGFPPKLTDAEVITMEICAEFLKKNTDLDAYKYFKKHYLHFFPNLPHRTNYARQSANLWQVKAMCQQKITQICGQHSDHLQPIDTLPLPVCTYTRGGRRDKRFPTLADYGHCAAKKMDYYGFKLGIRISRIGMIIHYPLLSARAHDVNHLGTLLENFAGLVPADKGFIDEYQQKLWQQVQQTQVITPVRSNMKTSEEESKLAKQTSYWRKRVETVNSQLTERFNITKIKVKDLWHYQNRINRKILAHTVGVFFNIMLGNQPLQLAGLIID